MPNTGLQPICPTHPNYAQEVKDAEAQRSWMPLMQTMQKAAHDLKPVQPRKKAKTSK